MTSTDRLSELKGKLELQELSPQTVRNYMYAYKRWLLHLNNREPTTSIAESWLSGANHVVNRYLLRKLQELYPEEYTGIEIPAKKGRKADLLPNPFSEGQIRLLFERMPRRFHNLMWLLFETGMRISEALNLRYRQIDEDEQTITFIGKGRKEQKKFPSADLINALIDEHPNGRRTKNGRLIDAYVFRHPQDDSKPLYPQIFWHHLQKSMEGAHAHRYRHSFATSLVREDVNLKVVQELMGHRTIQSTQKYVAVSEEQLREGAEKRRLKP